VTGSFIWSYKLFDSTLDVTKMQTNKDKKLLLMGKSESGKTSMHSIIFADYPGTPFLPL
jgi:ABC-type molybdenum transport system ATPase subunit/photorepair protein PhrA